MAVEEINGGEREESGIGEVDMDLGEDGSMTCTKHPNNQHNKNPGGICALCLQEKLGNLVSASLPIANFPPASFSFRSESTRTFGHSLSINNRKPRIPFLSNKNATSLQRSKSTAAASFPDGQQNQQRRSFWSFLYYSKSRRAGLSSANSNSSSNNRVGVMSSTRASSVGQSATTTVIAEEEENSHAHTASTANKVSRSRSVGCGSGSFSGDFFERLGDCKIRRVESQRQSNVAAAAGVDQQQQHKGIKERVRCGGIFGGFNLTSQWVPSTVVEEEEEAAKSTTGRMNASSSSSSSMMHGRSRSWAWALGSPLRAFVKPSTTSTSSNNRLPPSLLSASGSSR